MALAFRSVLGESTPTPPQGTVYGIHIDGNESDSANALTYLEDAVGMTPAHMDFTNDVFDYGSWENAFFMPRPCMLKSDGTVDYYLDPDDYTKKADGTASDISNTSYDGNAMMEWGQNGKKIWIKIVPEVSTRQTISGNIKYIRYGSASIYISDVKMDDDYHDWSFHNTDGVSVDHFYTAIYNSSKPSGNKLRSLSGQAPTGGYAYSTACTTAESNNPNNKYMWHIETYADYILICVLSMLIFKTRDLMTALGQGLYGGDQTSFNAFITGVHNSKGLFYGTNSSTYATYTNAIKLFGMENYYGLSYRRISGIATHWGAPRFKMTFNSEDGSNITDFEQDGRGYLSAEPYIFDMLGTGATHSGLMEMAFTKYGFYPHILYSSGTYSHYKTTIWYKNDAIPLTISSYESGMQGIFAMNAYYYASSVNWYFTANLTCRPEAPEE